jgi:hypothetical protein
MGVQQQLYRDLSSNKFFMNKNESGLPTILDKAAP